MQINDITNFDKLLLGWNKLENIHISMITNMISSEPLRLITAKYDESHINQEDLGLNVFTLISDLYYRENFHSDIICEFLNPLGHHNQGNKYLMNFLDMMLSKKAHLIKTDFLHAKVCEEEHTDSNRRIDILIKDEVSKKAIIIENKMNNAVDMNRQLPDYYNYMSRLGYDVVSIVYIPLSDNKTPDKTDWTHEEIKAIENILQIIPAYANDNKINLYSHWLNPSIINSDDIDCVSILRQYAKLIKHLNIKTMDELVLEKFYEYLKTDENLKTAIAMKNMMDELPKYLAIKLRNRYSNNYYPFAKITIYSDSCTEFKGYKLKEDDDYKLDIWCDVSGYSIIFWNPNDKKENIKETYSSSKALSTFEHKDDCLNSIFLHLGFDEEDKLIQIIDNLLEELRHIKQNSES